VGVEESEDHIDVVITIKNKKVNSFKKKGFFNNKNRMSENQEQIKNESEKDNSEGLTGAAKARSVPREEISPTNLHQTQVTPSVESISSILKKS